MILYNGNYDYYLEKKAERARNEAEKAAQHPEKSVAAAQPVSDTKNDWLKQKEQQAAAEKQPQFRFPPKDGAGDGSSG